MYVSKFWGGIDKVSILSKIIWTISEPLDHVDVTVIYYNYKQNQKISGLFISEEGLRPSSVS